MKRTSMLCALALLVILVTALPAFSVPEMYSFQTSGPLPFYIDFVLNSKSDVKIEILPCDSAGVLTGDPAIRTEVFEDQPKGQWKPMSGASYSWDGMDDYGNNAQNGYYKAKVTCTNVGTNSATKDIYGKNTYQLDTFPMKPTEAVPDPGPGYRGAYMTKPAMDEAGYRNALDNTTNFNTTGSVCWMGMAINNRKASPYYGWMYVGNTVGTVGVKTVYVYGPDGAYKGKLPDPTSNAYGGSAPYGIAIAADDFIYVWDRSTMRIHCFDPSGYNDGGTPADKSDDIYGTYKSNSPQINNWVGGNMAVYDAGTGKTMLYGQQSSNPGTVFNAKTYQIELAADHMTWGTSFICRPNENVYSNGLYVTPDNLEIFATSSYDISGGTTPAAWLGVRHKTRANTSSTFGAVDSWGTQGARSIYVGGVLVKEDWERLTFTGLLNAEWKESDGPPVTYYTWKLSLGAFETPAMSYQISSANLKTNINNLLEAAGDPNRVVDCDFTGNGTSTPYVRRWTYGVPPTTVPALVYSDTSPDDAANATFFVSSVPGDKQIAVHNGSYVGGDISTRRTKDIQLSADGTFFWVTTGSDTATPNIFKLDYATGCIIEPGKTSPGISQGAARVNNNIAPDGVGNFGLTWGSTSGTPAAQGIWFGIFDWGVKTDTVKTADDVIFVGGDNPPTLVPGSVQWSVNPLTPDGVETTDVTFKVIDGNGWDDIGSVVLDLKELKLTGGTTTQSASIVQDTSDPNGKKAIVTLTGITAVPGTRIGTRSIDVKFYDVDHNNPDPKFSSSIFQLQIPANLLTATVRHTRTEKPVGNAIVTVVGGVPGVWGYPNTYSATADSTGIAQISLSEGEYVSKATLAGYKTQPDQAITSEPYPSMGSEDVYLGPLSVAEAKALVNGYMSVEGVVYAAPQGGVYKGAFVAGMGGRVYDSGNVEKQSLYIVDPSDPAKMGLMVQLTKTGVNYGSTANPVVRSKQWDDPTEINTATGNSTYIGKRPEAGETICISGLLSEGSGSAYERTVEIDSASLEAASQSDYKSWYMNLTDLSIVPNVGTINPVVVTAPNVTKSTVDTSQYGKFAKIENVKVLTWRPNSVVRFADGTSSTDPVDYVIVQDSLGNNAPIAFTTRASYGWDTATCPVEIGAKYNFTGALGKLMKYDQGTIRVMGPDAAVKVADADDPIDPDTVGSIRGQETGQTAAVRGIVTKTGTGYFYIESSDRSAGVKVKLPTGSVFPTYVATGNDVGVRGEIKADATTGIRYIEAGPQSIERYGTTTTPLTALDMGIGHNDVGGNDSQNDKGITVARGPLNIGLYVTVMGQVTSRDSTGNFYIYDGSVTTNSTPLEDGSGNRGLRIAHTGWMPLGAGQVPNVARALVPYQDFVMVKGIVEGMKIGDNIVPVINPITVNVVSTFDAISSDTALLPGDNLFSLPGAPAATGTGEAPDYYAGTNLAPYEVPLVFAPNDAAAAGLNRFDNPSQSTAVWDYWAPDAFGGMTVADGYWANVPEAWTISYSGKLSTIPQWIAVPQEGYATLGSPHNYNTEVESIKLSDGAVVKSLRDANQNSGDPWVNSIIDLFDNTAQSTDYIGLEDDWMPGGTAMKPWFGYGFTMFQGNKALIIP